jgi:hypothetical protein
MSYSGDLAGHVVECRHRRAPERNQDAGADRADDAAHAVDAEHIERVVIAERVLHGRAEEVADHAGDEAEDDRAADAGETGSRRDRNKTRDETRD